MTERQAADLRLRLRLLGWAGLDGLWRPPWRVQDHRSDTRLWTEEEAFAWLKKTYPTELYA